MKELKINSLKQDIAVFEDVYSKEQCSRIADAFKSKAFGIISGIKRMFKKSDIVLNHVEKRYEPFWHVSGKSIFEYKRKTTHEIYTKPEVKEIKVNNDKYSVNDGKCSITVEERCYEEYKKELIIDAASGDERNNFAKYLLLKSRKISQTEELMNENTVVIPAKIKVSALVRMIIKDLIKPIEADKIIKENLELESVRLYFRPLWAFEFMDKVNNKIVVINVDALTGEVRKGNIYKKSLKEIFSEKELFEIGTEFIGDFIPGTRSVKMIIDKIKDSKK